ncbi:hypothetical protein [Haloferula rosea]|uniref:Uncharacterized protein n=1 Tax=Haloferula rosea TaxID=490093 RepID=A0A934RFJ5_9BACT|nr:hypothetical protein [Haloferula rosea]MBK1828688.1 hypothetical protein [Haloferula rosea]
MKILLILIIGSLSLTLSTSAQEDSGKPEKGVVELTKPVPAKPIPAKPIPAKPIPAKPIPAKPIPAKPVPARPVPAKPVPAKPVPAKPVPARPVPARPVPAKPVPAKPVPAKPVPAKPVPAKPILNIGVNAKVPTDQQVLQSLSPEFSWSVRGPQIQGQSSQFTLTILSIEGSNSLQEALNNNQVVYQKTLTKANALNHSATFPDLTLENNKAYMWSVAWRRGNLLQSSWNRFVVTTYEIGDPDSEGLHSCHGNLVKQNTFTTQNGWAAFQGSPSFKTSQGHDDPGYCSLKVVRDQSDVIIHRLPQALEQNAHYHFQCSVRTQKNVGGMPRLMVIAYNGTLTSLEPGPDTQIIGRSGNLPVMNEWTKIELHSWRAPKAFQSIAIAVFSGDASTPAGEIQYATVDLDRICLHKIDHGECVTESEIEVTDGQYVIPDEYLSTGGQQPGPPVETLTDENNGSVRDLYPNADLGSLDWLTTLENEGGGCFSVGGEVPQAEIDQIKGEYDQRELDALNQETTDMDRKLGVQFNTDTSELEPIVHEVNKACDQGHEPKLDPSKPFGGRDIVYIHGLQMKALQGNLKPTPTFQGKWPLDRESFFRGGEFYEEAEGYWSQHITRGLGSTTSPSNSYLIATYSANQRLPFAVHAVLTQISEAIQGSNQGVVWKAGMSDKKCFGENGIIIVTHSTGGLVASTMFGIAEASRGPTSPERETYGKAYEIIEKVDGQVGLNSAYQGSPMAPFALGLAANAGIPGPNTVRGKILRQWLKSDLQNIENLGPLFGSILIDLAPSNSRQWAERYYGQGDKPTLTLSSGFPGLEEGSLMTWPGKFIVPSFDDGVLSVASQSGSRHAAPMFRAQKSHLLIDMGVPRVFKRTALGAERRDGLFSGKKHYAVVPYYSQTGMLQSQSVESILTPVQNWPNHYSVIQTTGNHFDNVNMVYTNGNDYAATADGCGNFEESSVVTDSNVYSIGALNSVFQSLTNEHVRKKTWGLHLPRIKIYFSWQGWRPIIRIEASWVYKEFVIWKRTYHLLDDYKTKMGMDYFYEYAFRD